MAMAQRYCENSFFYGGTGTFLFLIPVYLQLVLIAIKNTISKPSKSNSEKL